MTEQWQELKETIKELRYSNGDLTQQEVCSFLGVYMETLEKQMQESTYAKGTIIKSALKYLVKRQIEEGSVGFAVDNDHDHDCCWDDALAWIEAQPSEDCISREEAIEKAINTVDEWDGGCNKRRAEMIEKALKNLPPIKPTSEDIKEAYLKGYDYGVKDWFKSKTQPSEDCISNYIKHKIDYLEDLASIETNEGRWREEEKYLYAISVLEEIVEYMNTNGGSEDV